MGIYKNMIRLAHNNNWALMRWWLVLALLGQQVLSSLPVASAAPPAQPIANTLAQAEVTPPAAPTLPITPTVEPPIPTPPAGEPTATPLPTIEPPAPVTTPVASLFDLIPANATVVTATAAVDGVESATLNDGAALFMGGRLAVIANADTWGSPVTLRLTAHTTAEAVDPQLALTDSVQLTRFTLEAVDANTGVAVPHFAQPVHLALDLRGLASITTTNWYLAYQDAVTLTDWHHVGVYVHDETGLISAYTDHFSSWAAGTEPGAWHYQWRPPTVAQFSGAATYQYPIPVPPGRAGLTPNLDASYSTRGIDMALGSGQDQGPLGMGWSIGSFEVTRDDTHYYYAYGTNFYEHPDKFSLSLNGGSYHLLPGGNNYLRQAGNGANWDTAFARKVYTTPIYIKVWVRVDNAATAEAKIYLENGGTPTSPNCNYVRQGFYIQGGNLYHDRLWYEGCTEKHPTPSNPISITSNTWYQLSFRVVDGHVKTSHSAATGEMDNTYLQSVDAWRLYATTKIGNTDFNAYDEIAPAGYLEPFSALNSSDWAYTNTVSHTVTFEQNSTFSDDWVQRYYAKDGPGLYVERRYEPTNTDPALNPDKFYWVVKTGNGTTYRLGYTQNAESGQNRQTYTFLDVFGHPGADQSNYSGLRWRVDTITDISGNQIQYRYDQWLNSAAGVDSGMRRLAELRYNFNVTSTNPLSPVISTTAASIIKLVDTSPGDILTQTNKIELYHVDLNTPYRIISFGLDKVTSGNSGCEATTNRVLTITEQISGGASLPATTFGYQALVHNPFDANCNPFSYLAQAYNGYGARMDFYYQSDGRFQGGEYGASYVVTQTKTWDGLNSLPAVVSYTYATPCYDVPTTGSNLGTLPGAYECPQGMPQGIGDHNYYGPLVGFKTVTVTALAFDGTPAATAATWFHQDAARSGRSYLAQTLDPVTGAVLQQTDSAYLTTTMTNTTFSYLGAVTSTAFYSGGHSLSRRTEYDYATANQGDAQYGNQTHVREYDETGALYRQTVLTYYPNIDTSKWLVNHLAVQEVWDAQGNVLSRVRNHYSNTGPTNYTQPPQYRGLLTTARVWTGNSNQWKDVAFTYDLWGNQLSQVEYQSYGTDSAFASANPRGMTTTFDSTYHLYPVQMENAKGYVTTIGYSLTHGLPLTMTDVNGNATTFRYDVFGRLLKVIRPGDSDANPTVRYEYLDAYNTNGLQGLRINEIHLDPNTLPIVQLYDGLGRLVQTRSETMDGTTQSVTRVSYDALGRTVTTTLPQAEAFSWDYQTLPTGAAWVTTTYDALGQAVKTTAPDGAVSRNISGYGTQITEDPNGHLRLAFTDGFGRVTAVNELLTAWSDDFANGTLASEWTTSGTVTESGGVAYITDTAYLRNPVGTSITDHTALGVVFSFYIPATTTQSAFYLRAGTSGADSYRKWGLSTSGGVLYREIQTGTAAATTMPLLTLKANTWYRALLKAGNNTQAFVVTVWERDNPGVSAIRREVLGSTWYGQSWDYMAQIYTNGNNVRVDDYAEVTYYTTRYLYNVRDQLIRVTDTLTVSTVISYDFLGQKTSMTDPNMGTWLYDYNALGQMITQTDARGCKLVFGYNDPLGRLTDKTYAGTNCGATTSPVVYSYDSLAVSNGKGQRTQMFDGTGWAAWEYDARGQVISTSVYLTGTGTYPTRYRYNSAGQVVSMTYPGGSNLLGETVLFTYTAGGLPYTVKGTNTYLQDAAYDASGRPLTYTYNYAVRSVYTYYPWTQQGGRLQTLVAGRINSTTLYQNLAYTYDPLGNVLSIVNTKAAPNETQNFTYDSLDRLTQADLVTSTTTSESYTFDAVGKLLSMGNNTYTYDATHKHAVASVTNGPSFSYDANGNVTTHTVSGGQTARLTYDAEGRVVKAESYASGSYTTLATFAYNGDGQRVLSTQGTTTTVNLGNYYEFDTANTFSRTYYYAGGQRVAIRERSSGSNAFYFLLGDHLGSTSVAVNSDGTFKSELRYEPWGETRYSSGTTPTDFRYTGQKQTLGDGLEWLYYYNARWYDPTVGRFLQADTIVPEPLSGQGFNRYAYVSNNPMKYTDPSGHAAEGSCREAMAGTSQNTSDFICNAYDDLQAGKTDSEAVRGLAGLLFLLLQGSATGRTLIDALGLTENDIVFASLETLLGQPISAQATTDGDKIYLNPKTFIDDINLLATGKAPGEKYNSYINVIGWWAASIGHEAYHMAIGDSSMVIGNRILPIGQSYGDGGDVSTAYRVHGIILNEIVYGGDRSNYQDGSILTTAAAEGGWGYPQVTASPATVWNDVKNANFRVPVTTIQSVLQIPCYIYKPRYPVRMR